MSNVSLLPYQRQWLAETAPLRVCLKSRRIGITWAQACDDVLMAAAKGRAGADVLYIGYNEEMTKEYIETAAFWARELQVAAQAIEQSIYHDEQDLKTFTLRFQSGHKILALSSRPRNLRGKQGRIVIDEAAFHDDLVGLLKASAAMRIWGGERVVISTHNGEGSAFHQLVLDIRAGKVPGAVHEYDFDRAIADGLCKRTCLVLGIEWSPEFEAKWRQDIIDEHGADAPEELFCIPAGRREGALWDQKTIIEHSVTEAPPLERIVVGVDPMGSATSKEAMCGIVTAGRNGQHLYVLTDDSIGGRPHQWASAAIATYRALMADCIAAEVNYGGDMVEETITSVDKAAKVLQVRATRGKLVRAEPIAALYDKGLVHHVGRHPALEREMCQYDGKGKSPNRMDALVWALTELTGGQTAIERLRQLTTGAIR